MTNDTTPLAFERHGKKDRLPMTATPELLGALDALLDDEAPSRSEYAERAIWRALVDDYGEAAVRRAIRDTQAKLPEHQRMNEPKQYPSG